MSHSAGDVMTSAEVAQLLHETVKTVEAWARDDVLPGFKLGRRWKFRRHDIDAVIERARGKRGPLDA